MERISGEAPVREAYAFVCLDCGHGWEEEYGIRHLADAHGLHHTAYFSHGHRVPSPLNHGRCPGCESKRVRILRPGRVSTARNA
ncbi:hypothetical protein AB0A70_24295 [Streptomyces morookaense]|uniref:hypothetical protein n=1 Tax=Streptomyces morookaense TaxID=1970 RepID=UPI00340A4DC6